jgi:HPt (histidine-containing phosphotransfer) domain-containing protein
MPGIDGLKTTELIRSELNISESEMQVICFSAAALNEDWQKYQNAGMNSFLSKPFTEEMLLTTILSLIEDYTPGAACEIKNEEKIEPATPGIINLQNLYHISGGDEQFIRQMLDSFIHTTQNGLEEIKESSIDGQLDKVSELAHKLMSPCHHIGAMNLYYLLLAIEKGAGNRLDAGKMVTLIEEAVKEFEDIRELLNRQITKMA